jgi:hypothetical protein
MIIFIEPHIKSLYNMPGGLAIDPIGMWVWGLTNKDTL